MGKVIKMLGTKRFTVEIHEDNGSYSVTTVTKSQTGETIKENVILPDFKTASIYFDDTIQKLEGN